jgi:hypothetical protein
MGTGFMQQYMYPDYQTYIEAQREINRRKADKVWVSPKAIKWVVDDASRRVVSGDAAPIQKVLCHGVRTGKEIDYFRQHLPEATVVGTDIGDTADLRSDIMKIDFNSRHTDWINTWHLVYSNSFGHAFDARITAGRWVESLVPRGLCYVEWSETNMTPSRTDPFKGTAEEYAGQFVPYAVVEVIKTDLVNVWRDREYPLTFIVVTGPGKGCR